MTRTVERELEKINEYLQRIDRTLRSLTESIRFLEELSRTEKQHTSIYKDWGVLFEGNGSMRDTADAVVAEWILRMSP